MFLETVAMIEEVIGFTSHLLPMSSTLVTAAIHDLLIQFSEKVGANEIKRMPISLMRFFEAYLSLHFLPVCVDVFPGVGVVPQRFFLMLAF